jgi:ComF family protein
LIDELRAEEREPLLIPVPLHRKKQRKRGYNQARVLANGISNRSGWPVVAEQSVVRVKNTITQTGLSSSERQNNLEGAFTLSQPIDYDKQIPVLVDDVFTTGATTFELARVLNVTAARKAVILTVASA